MFVQNLPEKGEGQFYLALTGFTNSGNHEIDPSDYIAAIRDSVKAGILRVRKSYPNLVVLRGSKGDDPSFDSLVAAICDELQIKQLVFTVASWCPFVVEEPETTVVVVEQENEDSFGSAMISSCDLLMAFGGGLRAAGMVRTAIFTHQKHVVLVSPYSALGLTDVTKRQTVERLIARVKATPSSKKVTVQEEIDRIVDQIVSKSISLKRSKELYGLCSDPEANYTLPSIGVDQDEPGVFSSADGCTVVRWLDKTNSYLPPNSEKVATFDNGTGLYERRFLKARLVPLEGLPSIVGKLDGLLPLGAVGYSAINSEREALLGINLADYENLVCNVMQVIACKVKEKLSPANSTLNPNT